MRLNFRRKPELAVSADCQNHFWNEWHALSHRPLSKITDPLEALHHLSHELGQARAAGDEAAMRRLVAEGTRRFPREPLIRNLAADTYRQLGEPYEAIAHLAVAIAVEPEFPNAYPRLARLLHERGDREAAIAVLESGWKRRQREVRRSERAAEKTRYFAILDRPPPVHPG